MFFGTTFATGAVFAQPERERVSIVLGADPENQKRLTQVLAELLGRLGVTPEIRSASRVSPVDVVTPPVSPERALARVFIDATDRDVAVVYIVDAGWERILVRRVPLPAGLDEVVREEIGHIVESSVEALRAGGKIGVSREQASEELGVPVPAPSAERPRKRPIPRSRPVETERRPVARQSERRGKLELELDLGLGWEASFWTSDHLRHGPIVRLDLGTALVGGTLLAQYRMPVSEDAEPIGLRQESGALRALGFLRPTIAKELRLRFELGVGLDFERLEPRITEDGATSVSDVKTRAAFIARAGAGLELRVFDESWLSVVFALEMDPSPDDYVIQRGTRTESVVEPLFVRPGLALVLATPLAGN